MKKQILLLTVFASIYNLEATRKAKNAHDEQSDKRLHQQLERKAKEKEQSQERANARKNSDSKSKRFKGWQNT
jgi:hypothetical protein